MTVVVDPDATGQPRRGGAHQPGGPEADAELVSDSLVTADLWGHPSHGMLRLPWYAARLRSGVMTAVTSPEIVTDLAAVAVLDGRDGVGQVVTDAACTRPSSVRTSTAPASSRSATATTSAPPPTGRAA